ncbi:hypothetical protein Tco_0134550 [Tanacetum coccineum]
MKNRNCTLSKNDLKDLVKTYRIPLDLHPCFPDLGFTMDHLPDGTIGIYSEFLWFSGVCIPFSTFLLSVLKYFKVHISQLVPLDRRAIPDYLTWRHSCSCVSDDLPTDGYDRNDVERLCARLIYLLEMREEVLVHSGLSSVWFNKECDLGDAKVVEESHHLSSPLLERVLSHTTAPAAEDVVILLPTPDEIAASLLDPRLVKKSKGPSQVRVCSTLDTALEPSRPSKKRKLRKRASKPSFSAPELGQDKGVDEADLTDYCAKIENSLERDEGTSARAASAPASRLGKRLGAPLSMAVVSASGPSYVGTSAHASTYRCNFSLRGVAVSGHAGKSGSEVMRRQMDLLDSLARSALAHDVEYDQILEDDFGTATRGEEIDLTLFPLTPGPYQMKALDQTITPAKLKRTESLLLLDLSNCFNFLSALLVSYGVELNSRYTVTTLDGKLERMQKDYDALGQENRELRSQKDDASDKVKELHTELTDARVANIGLSEELSLTDAKLSDQALVVRDLENELALEMAKSQGYKMFDEFHAALAHVASVGINYGVERGLRMGRIDAEFEVAPRKFLTSILVTQVLPDKHIRSVTYVPVAPPIANEDANQVPLERASDDSAAST